MNLFNPGRGVLSRVPGLNGVIDKITAAINAVWAEEHNPDGSHGIIHERDRTTAMGVWADVPFAPGNFTASGTMTWTVAIADQVTLRYTLIGMTMHLVWSLRTTTIAAPVSSQLYMALPSGYQAAKGATGHLLIADPTFGSIVGYAYVETDGRRVIFEIEAGALVVTNWAVSTNQTDLEGGITFEIEKI